MSEARTLRVPLKVRRPCMVTKLSTRATSPFCQGTSKASSSARSEEHTSELQSQSNLVCRLLLESAGYHPYLHSFPTRRSSDLLSAANAVFSLPSFDFS